MVIEEVHKITAVRVTTDEDEYCEYTRYSADNWFVTRGNSDEPFYHCEAMEELYQEYIAKKGS